MSERALLRCFRVGFALWSTQALAQSTDPTEPSDSAPALTIPRKEGPNNVEAGTDEEEIAVPGDPWGDSASDGLIGLRALFQARYISTFAKDSRSARESYRVREDYLAQHNDGYSLNRVFLRIGSDPSPYVGFKAVLDFAELLDDDPEDVLRQAYASLRPIPGHLEFVVGMFKLPFSVLELDASSRYELSDFGAANRLGGDLGFAGRDLGVQVLAAPFKKAKRLRLSLGAFRGHMKDEHDSPVGALGGRAESKPNKHWRFGADLVQHLETVTYNRAFELSDNEELPNPPNPLYPAQKHWGKGRAFSADVRYKRKGLMLRGEAQYGDRVDLDERYGAKTWWAAWGLCAYRIELPRNVRLLPAVRFEWLDIDREHTDRGVMQQLTLGTSVLFLERVRFVLDATRVQVQANTPVLKQPKPLQLQPYLALDHWRVTAQLQVEL
ncbi:MAG: hypothetical protein ABW352_04490 [Polyangiales bacterium]